MWSQIDTNEFRRNFRVDPIIPYYINPIKTMIWRQKIRLDHLDVVCACACIQLMNEFAWPFGLYSFLSKFSSYLVLSKPVTKSNVLNDIKTSLFRTRSYSILKSWKCCTYDSIYRLYSLQFQFKSNKNIENWKKKPLNDTVTVHRWKTIAAVDSMWSTQAHTIKQKNKKNINNIGITRL